MQVNNITLINYTIPRAKSVIFDHFERILEYFSDINKIKPLFFQHGNLAVSKKTVRVQCADNVKQFMFSLLSPYALALSRSDTCDGQITSLHLRVFTTSLTAAR